jgi:hypothetical protein
MSGRGTQERDKHNQPRLLSSRNRSARRGKKRKRKRKNEREKEGKGMGNGKGRKKERRTPLSVADDEDPHLLVVVQTGEELWREEEELARFGTGGRRDELVVDFSLGSLVHSLIDPVQGEREGGGKGASG